MTFLEMGARGQHGYPQPEDDYEELVYADSCLRCGIHDRQVAPFSIKRSQRAPHSHFFQLNWVFDAFFVHPEVIANIEAARITGVSFGPVLDHRTGHELSDRVQLVISAIVPCAET